MDMKRGSRLAADNGYYNVDFDVQEILIENGQVDELFYLKDLKQRKLFLNTEINQVYIAEIAKHILQFNKEDKGVPVEDRIPILLYVISEGGEVDSGFELIDIIRASKTPVYTINLGYWYSMGFLIGLAGHKRFAMPNAKFLHHDGTNVIINSGTKAKDQMEFQDRIERRIADYVISRTNVTAEEYKEHMRQEWYLFADEAKEHGMIDCIIGVDCDIDEVI